ncbi:MAG: hypothetical protein WCF36_06840 [Candidatus Nanopelagicales bacterium]
MPDPRRPGDRLIRTGLVVTAIGMLLTLVALLPLVSDIELPSMFWWLAMLWGVGLALILVGLLRNGRGRARAQIAARELRD